MTKKPRRTLRELEKDLKNPLSSAVRARRKALGYTQAELADRAGVSLHLLEEFELGRPTVRLDKALQIIEFLGGSIHASFKQTE